MTCGPWATVLGAQLLGLRFRKLLKLDAWCLHLSLDACSLQLEPRTLVHGSYLF